MVERRSRLTTIDDLKVLDPLKAEAASRYLHDLNLGGCDRDPVVVREKAFWLFEYRAANRLIHLAAGLKEGTNVQLKEPRPVLSVDLIQDITRDDREVGLILTIPGRSDKTWNRFAESFAQVDFDRFAALP
jgi:hypothetical protein